MATKDNSSGLLSKVARFVRNPTKDWSELDKPEPEPEPESGYSKQALKEMIERKRQNDFVRRREFDHLRKLRRNVPVINPDFTGRPSYFQSSMASNPDERAITLKKIDDIEAQMSKQWWKGRQDEAAVHGPNPAAGAHQQAATVGAPVNVAAGQGTKTLVPRQPSDLSHDGDLANATDYEPTQMGLPGPGNPGLRADPRQPRTSLGKESGGTNADSREFSTSALFSIESGGGLSDPDLEEAAIRFANGDDAGAEAGLLAALRADNISPDSADGWAAALFDLYRATGQQASFDRVAIDYALRFGRSAPAWFSTPDLLGRNPVAAGGAAVAAAQGSQPVWECPAELDLPAVQAMLASLSRAAMPWRLHWDRLNTITPEAAKALASLFAQWCVQPVTLHFGGAEVLEKTLRNFTPSGDRRVESCWWQLRLDALRILRLQDEFELAALDYCVTFEVSPPPWADAQCECVQTRVSGPTALDDFDGLARDGDLAQAPLTRPDLPPAAVVELCGEVLGDAAEALDQLQAGLKGANRLVISCARLIRVDFSAAGSILNWVAVREAEGCQVQFRDVSRLVAAFFNVIGINEHARIILRTS